MKKSWKFVALTLVIAFILQISSVIVFAKETTHTNENNAQSNSILQTETTEKQSHILFEDEGKRTETEKHFKMSDGSYKIAMYEEPVHFRDNNGSWQDYDNTLVSDDAVTTEEDKEYSVKKNNIKIKLSKKSNKKIATIKKDGYEISWGYADGAKSNAEIIQKQGAITGDDVFIKLKNVSKEVWYRNVYNDVDLQYFIMPNGIKENIVLKTLASQSEFILEYSIDKLKVIVLDKKTIELRNVKNEVIYTIRTPIMIDAKGQFSEQLSLSVISQKNKKLVLKIQSDKDWINSEERMFPIKIDPVVETEQKSNKIQYTYTNSLQPTTSWSSDYYLYAGSNSLGKTRSYMRFTLPTLPKSSIVTTAQLNIGYCNDGYSFDPGTAGDTLAIEARDIGKNGLQIN